MRLLILMFDIDFISNCVRYLTILDLFVKYRSGFLNGMNKWCSKPWWPRGFGVNFIDGELPSPSVNSRKLCQWILVGLWRSDWPPLTKDDYSPDWLFPWLKYLLKNISLEKNIPKDKGHFSYFLSKWNTLMWILWYCYCWKGKCVNCFCTWQLLNLIILYYTNCVKWLLNTLMLLPNLGVYIPASGLHKKKNSLISNVDKIEISQLGEH